MYPGDLCKIFPRGRWIIKSAIGMFCPSEGDCSNRFCRLAPSRPGAIRNLSGCAGGQAHAASHGMESVFLRNGRYAAHVGLWLRPFLGCFGEEMFKTRGSDIDEHGDSA
jgi:hypothetical protein